MQNIIEGSLAMGWFLTTFLIIYRMLKALEPKEATCPAAVRYRRCMKAK